MSDFKHYDKDSDEEDFGPSRTQIKREAEALQKMGLELVELGDKFLAQIGLEGALADAVYQARGMKHREGRRRQLQFIGKLMRSADHEAISEKLVKVKNIGRQHSHIQQQTESWLERLVEEGNSALQEFIQTYSVTDAQHLRQLLRNTQKEKKFNKVSTNSDKLFHYIRELLEQLSD